MITQGLGPKVKVLGFQAHGQGLRFRVQGLRSGSVYATLN